MTGRWLEPTLREQHQRVVQEVGGLAGERGAGLVARRARRLGRLVVLGGEQDLGRLLGDLARRRGRRRRRAARPCTSPRAGRRRASAIVAHSVSSQAKPWVRGASALGGAGIGVEARAGPAVAGRPAGSTPSSRASPSQSIASDRSRRTLPRRLALAPQPAARTRVEVHLARRQRRRERLGVQPADHQDPPVGLVLDDAGDEPVRAPRDVGGSRPASSATGPAARRSCRRPERQPDREPGRGHGRLDLGDRDLAPVEHATPPARHPRRPRARPRRSRRPRPRRPTR